MRGPARLTGALLARKGLAEPASGPRGANAAPGQPLPFRPGAQSPTPARAPAATLTLLPRPNRASAPGGAGGDGSDRVALTVRLDGARHRRLKILAARRRRTSQAVLIEALDALLDSCGAECACLRGEPGGCARN